MKDSSDRFVSLRLSFSKAVVNVITLSLGARQPPDRESGRLDSFEEFSPRMIGRESTVTSSSFRASASASQIYQKHHRRTWRAKASGYTDVLGPEESFT